MSSKSSAAEFLRILRERGFLHQCSDPADDLSGLAGAAPGGG